MKYNLGNRINKIEVRQHQHIKVSNLMIDAMMRIKKGALHHYQIVRIEMKRYITWALEFAILD